MHKFTLETRGDISVLRCNHCRLPILEVKNGEIEVESKHGSSKHRNTLTIEHLRMLAVAMFSQSHPPERW